MFHFKRNPIFIKRLLKNRIIQQRKTHKPPDKIAFRNIEFNPFFHFRIITVFKRRSFIHGLNTCSQNAVVEFRNIICRVIVFVFFREEIIAVVKFFTGHFIKDLCDLGTFDSTVLVKTGLGIRRKQGQQKQQYDCNILHRQVILRISKH
ncbi:hypothetical protein SDC9_112116 [bioreactor metagenome]|uniref:Uncharacterized protein n=1 Tax=bioreactor metagenome TaxID=1076179 RepID=A0A645BL04_9ZZZZ